MFQYLVTEDTEEDRKKEELKSLGLRDGTQVSCRHFY